MLTKLTEYRTGNTIYVDVSRIVSMRRLEAKIYSLSWINEVPKEFGERTRIDTNTDMFIVCETPEEIMGAKA